MGWCRMVERVVRTAGGSSGRSNDVLKWRTGGMALNGWLIAVLGFGTGAWMDCAHASNFDLPMGRETLHLNMKTTLIAGTAIRMEAASPALIGKSNLNPSVCSVPYQNCQGVYKDQIFPAQQLVRAPGAASVNSDDGNLNYASGSFVQGGTKLSNELTLSYRDFGFKASGLYFYDAVNNSLTENHPDRITAANKDDANVGITPQTPLYIAYPGSKVYGPGAQVSNKRSDGEVLNQVGSNFQLLEAYLYGKFTLWGDRPISFKLGRQVVSWGESATLIGSGVNQANPINSNNLFRYGVQTNEVFTPINMAFVHFEPIDYFNVEAYYQLEWRPSEINAPGSYFSTLDIGSNNAINNLNLGFGGTAEDPDSVARLQYNPFALLTNTTLTAQRLPDAKASGAGQFGLKLDYFATWLNHGTDLSFYYQHYNSHLPYLSFYAANPSCARAAGNANNNDAANFIDLFRDCPETPQRTRDPENSPSSVAALSSVKFQLQYPDSINLLGAGFNTSIGDYSLKGELAYWPSMPLQVDTQDLLFAAFGPTLTNCSDPNTGCAGTARGGIGFDETGARVLYGSSDFTVATGAAGTYNDTFKVTEGALPGVARAFPNFIVPYRGGTIGANPGCSATMTVSDYKPGIPCWIQGWEKLPVFNLNLGVSRMFDGGRNWLHADRIMIATEFGLTYVPGLPSLDKLQFEAPGTDYAASAGADGSGFKLSDPSSAVSASNPYVPVGSLASACSTTPDCSYGPDGLRANPHQQDSKGYPDRLSWGYRIVGMARYEHVIGNIGFQPMFHFSQDVQGTSPGPGGAFIAGRDQIDALLETRYRSSLSFTVGYTWFMGGGPYNLLADRDFAQAFVKYQF